MIMYEGIYLRMSDSNFGKTIDVDLAKGLGLHMVLIWGRVALVQGIPSALSYNSLLIVVCTMCLVMYYLYVFFIKHKCIPKVNQGAVLTAVFVLITLAFTFVMWPENKRYMDPIGNTIFYEVCPFLILSMIRNVGAIYDPMVKASRVLIILCAISSIGIVGYGHTTVSAWSTYSMPLSYATLYAVMWLMCDFFNKRRTFTLVLIIVGVLILVIFGSRNPLLSVAAYIVFNAIKNKNGKSWEKAMLIIALVIILIYGNQILISFNSIVQSFGIKSRTLSLFVEQRYFADDRTMIHQNIFEVLNKNPLGVGIAGDVAQTHEFTHGLYVSILCTYGYYIGTLVLLVLGAVLLKAYIKSSGQNRDIYVIYLLSVLPRGFTGGDIWSSDVFWWMLGIGISILYMKNIQEPQAIDM